MAHDDRWRDERDWSGRRSDERDSWRGEDRRESMGRGRRGEDRREDFGRGWRGEDRGFGGEPYGARWRESDEEFGYMGWGGSGRDEDERRRGRSFAEDRSRGWGYEGGFGGYGRDEGRSGYGGTDDRRGFYGADQGYGQRRGRDEHLEAAYREVRDRGDGHVGRDRNYGFTGGEDQSFWRTAVDEVRSWFGDDDPERRRREGERHHRGRGPRTYSRSDERIREDVNDRLTDDPFVDASEIDVAVQNREVTLSGTVSSRTEKRRAEDIAESVSGVTHVQNNLRVQTQTGTGMAGGTSAATGTGTGMTGMGTGTTGTAASGPTSSAVEVNRTDAAGRRTGTKA